MEAMAYLKMAYLLKMVMFHGYVKKPDGISRKIGVLNLGWT
jgi:hypothetical protein